MKYLKQKLNGLNKRIKCFPYGIFYIKNTGFLIPNTFWINWKPRKLFFLDRTNAGFIYEFTEICLNDCYRLNLLKGSLPDVHVIVDIGANQGLFCMAARQKFANANLFAYEPNIALELYYFNNASLLNVNYYLEAVTKTDCKVDLSFGATDLHTTTKKSLEGSTIGTSLKKVVDRAGGKIDILKIDCEGAEWELFDDNEAWENIRSVTMEYHLWAKPGSTHLSIKQIMENLNYKVIEQIILAETFGLIIAIKK